MENTEMRSERTCPYSGTCCIDGVRADFKDKDKVGAPIKCRLWVHMYGKDPQSEDNINQWDCAHSWLPITTIETAQGTRFNAASIDKLANEMHAMGGSLNKSLVSAAGVFKQLLEGVNENQRMLEQTLHNNGVIEVPPNGHGELPEPDPGANGK